MSREEMFARLGTARVEPGEITSPVQLLFRYNKHLKTSFLQK